MLSKRDVKICARGVEGAGGEWGERPLKRSYI
jgi:hypothetical protein